MPHMTYAPYIKELGRGAKGARSLSSDQAESLFGDMLDGKVPPLELGAILIALRIKSESTDELIGFKRALDRRTPQLAVPEGPRCVILPSYNGARRQPNLMPLLALLLVRAGVPVLIQGRHDFESRISPFELLAELDVTQADSTEQASRCLAAGAPACLGLDLLSPGLDRLLATRLLLGVRSVGLTHARRNAAGDGGVFAASGSSPAGLSSFGKAVVRECRRLGILLDLAHLNAAGVDDVLALTDGPLIISHSNPRYFHDIERNSSDAQIKAVAARGGVVGINAVLLTADRAKATLDHFVDHVAYVADLAGIDAVGIGFDFIEFIFRHWTPEQQAALSASMIEAHHVPGLTNHSHAGNVTRQLIARGFRDDEIEKVLYGNWLRVLKETIG